MKSFLRLLAAGLFLLLLVAGVIFYRGGKQLEYRAETLIHNTSLKNVMDHLSQPDLVKLWAEGVVEIRPQEDLEAEIGARGTLTVVDPDGAARELQNQVLAYSDTSLTIKTSGKEFEACSIWKLFPSGNDVQVRQLMLGTYKGFSRLEAPFYRDSVEQQMQSDLQRLASLIELGPNLSQSPDSGEQSTDE
jgi:hypothetical protein